MSVIGVIAVVTGVWCFVVLLVVGLCRAAARGDAELLWAVAREQPRAAAAGTRGRLISRA